MGEATNPEAKTSRIIFPGNFWFLPRTALFHPTEGDAGDAGDGGDDNSDNGDAGDAGEGGDGKGEQKKLVSLDRHKQVVGKKDAKINDLQSKIDAYETAEADRKKSEMSELEREKAEKAELKNKLSRFEADDKKQDALTKAKIALAKEGKAIDPEKEEFLNRSLRRLAFDESTLDDDVAELVNLASIKATPGHKTPAGKSSKPDESDRDAMSYTGKELGEILKENPEQYKAIMTKRKQAIAAKAREGK